MHSRKLGPFDVSAIGLGCMSLSHAYGGRPGRATAEAVLNKALDVGYTMVDTATLYGAGGNETLIGDTLKGRREEFILASKCGLYIRPTGRVIDGRPQTLRESLDLSLKNLQTDVIDLYYIHRLDVNTPIEESVGELSRAVEAGKIRAIGLSEMSAATLRRAHAVHPIAAMQTEYSLWTRNAEIAVLDACRELGAAFVGFSPVARGYLADRDFAVENLEPGDIRIAMPRFQKAYWEDNRSLLPPYRALAEEAGCTMAQLALAWVLAQGEHVIALPGTTRIDHLIENAAAGDLKLDPALLARAGDLINRNTVFGPRYNANNQLDIDTEEFAA